MRAQMDAYDATVTATATFADLTTQTFSAVSIAQLVDNDSPDWSFLVMYNKWSIISFIINKL